jgi:acetoin utilization protein AcuB
MTLVEKKFHQKSAVSDWMTPKPTTILGDARLIQAYNLMKENEFRRLPVVKRNGELIGIITLSDIVQHVPFFPDDPEVEVDLPLMTMTVQEIMTWDPETIGPADTIQEAAELMLEIGVSGLPVVEHDRVVGIITESDIFRLVIESWSSER